MLRDPRSVLPLNPRAFYILVSLAQGPAHGYAIGKEVETTTGGTVRLTAGTLYPLIRQMLADGLIALASSGDDDPRRRSYRLTPWGKKVAQAEALRLAQVLQMARSCDLLPAGVLA